GWDATWVARLARILSLQPFEKELHEFAFKALEASICRALGIRAPFALRKTFVELLYHRNDRGRALAMLEDDPELDNYYHGYLRADILNPFVDSSMASFDSWLVSFNRPFLENGVSGIRVSESSDTPFDGLTGTIVPSTDKGPLVTVIITTYSPNPTEVRSSLLSILRRTWENIEVLLVDVCSGLVSISVVIELLDVDCVVRGVR